MSEGNRPVMRIPSIFDSEDDSDNESSSPMTVRATAPANDSNGEPPPLRPPASSASSDDSEEEPLPTKRVASPTTGKKLTVSPPRDYLSSEEESSDEEGEEEKILDFAYRGGIGDPFDEDDEDDDDDDDDVLNVSPSSHEKLGSEDDDDDDEDDDEDDEDDNVGDEDDELDKSGSSLDYDEESDSKDSREVERGTPPSYDKSIIVSSKKEFSPDKDAKETTVVDNEESTDAGGDNDEHFEDSKEVVEDTTESKKELDQDLLAGKDLGSSEKGKEVICEREQPEAIEGNEFKEKKEGDGEKSIERTDEHKIKDYDSKSNSEVGGSVIKDDSTKDDAEDEKYLDSGQQKSHGDLEKQEKDLEPLEIRQNKDLKTTNRNEDSEASVKEEEEKSGALKEEANNSVVFKEKNLVAESEEKKESQNVQAEEKKENTVSEVVVKHDNDDSTEKKDGDSEAIKKEKPNNEDKEKDIKMLEKDHREMFEGDVKMEDHEMKMPVNEMDTDVESESRDAMTPKITGENCCSDTDTENTVDNEKSGGVDDELLSMSVKTGATVAGRSSGRIPVRVEDVYTDSEEEDSHEVPKGKEKIASDILGTSDTDSVDPEDQRDFISLPGSSRASSLEPGQTSRDLGVKKVPKEKIASDILATSDTDSVDPEDQRDFISLPGSSRASSLEPGQTSRDLGVKTPMGKGSPSSSSQKSDTQQTQGTSEICSIRSKKASSKSSVNVDDCMKAFKQGWKREIVFRATVDPNKGGTRADIYYYAPNGKKLRSKVEIEDHLSRNSITDISLDHFTWIKEPLGVSKEYEQIRHASKYVKCTTPTASVTPPPAPKPPIVVPVETEVQVPRKRGRGRPPKNPGEQPVKRARTKVNPIMSLKKETEPSVSPQPSVSVRSLGVQKTRGSITSPNTTPTSLRSPMNKNWKPAISLENPISLSSNISEQSIQPVPVKSDVITNKTTKTHIVYTTKVCNEPIISSRILTPMLSGESRQRTFHCTGHCPLGGGMVPCLQCVKCLCLFHPECTYMPPSTVNVIQAGAAKFLCPNCYRENKENVGAKKWDPPKPYEPLAYDPSSEDSENESEKIQKPRSLSNYARVTLQPETLTPPNSPPPSDYKSQLDAVAKSLGGPKVQTIVTISKAADTTTTVLTQSQAAHQGPTTVTSSGGGVGVHPTLGGNQLLQVQSPGSNAPRFILIRPGGSGEMAPVHSGPHLGMPRGILLPTSLVGGPMPFMMPGSSPQQQQNTPPPFMYPGFMQQQQQQQVPTSLMLSGGMQQQQVPPSLMTPGSVQPQQQQQLVSPVMLSVPPSLNQQQVAAMIQQAGPMMQQAYEKQQTSPSKGATKSEGKNFLRDLSQSYQILLRIFNYLSVKDLLVASRVCLLWRDLAYRSSLWETVCLRNVCVCDWNEFSRFLERRNTRYIDLRKMVLREKLNKNNTEAEENKDDINLPLGAKSSRSRECSSCLSPYQSTANHDSPSDVGVESSERVHSSAETEREAQEGATEGENIEDKLFDKSLPSQKSSKEIEGSPNLPENNSVTQSDQEHREKNESEVTMFEKIPFSKKDTQDDVKETLGSSDVNLSGDKLEDMEVTENLDSLIKNTEREKSEASASQKVQEAEVAREGSFLMECDGFKETTRSKDKIRKETRKEEDSLQKPRMRKTEKESWKDIFSALGSVSCLRGVTLPSCEGEVLQMLLSSCKHLTSVSATELRMTEGTARFDPAYLMEVPDLEELRIGSSHGFSLTTNFNFIKLQQLQLLVMRGLTGPSWPYLGTNLTSLHVGPINGFTSHTWSNIGSMTNLNALWLEEGGSVNDGAIFDALSRLYKLRRLCLFSFTLGPRLGQALRKLVHLERLFVLPAPSEEGNISTQNGNMLAVPEALRNLDMLIWAIRYQDIHTVHEIDHIEMCPAKAKMYTSFTSNEEAKSNLWMLPTLEAIVKRHLPRTKVRILKLDTTAASHLAMSTL